MTDDQQKQVKTGNRPGTFKKGFDERRWLKGRPRIPKDVKALFDNLVWEVLSEEVEHPITKEKTDRLRLMIRSMTTNKNMQDKLLDRVFGKVTEKIELEQKGISKVQIEYINSEDSTPETSQSTDANQGEQEKI